MSFLYFNLIISINLCIIQIYPKYHRHLRQVRQLRQSFNSVRGNERSLRLAMQGLADQGLMQICSIQHIYDLNLNVFDKFIENILTILLRLRILNGESFIIAILIFFFFSFSSLFLDGLFHFFISLSNFRQLF